MPDKVYLTKDDTREALWGDAPEGFEHVATEQIDSGRWRAYMNTVIRRVEDGQLFGTEWEKGLTENCDHEYPEVSTYGTCKWRPMIAKEVTTTTYEYTAA